MSHKYPNSVWHWSGTYQGYAPGEQATLQSLVQSLAGEHQTFLTYYEDKRRSRRLSFHELFLEASSTAKILRDILGAQFAPGDRIAIMATNSDQLIIIYCACFLLGLVIVPINPKESDQYVERVIQHAHCKLLISHDPRILSSCGTVLITELLQAQKSDDNLSLTPQNPRDSSAAEDIAAIFYTSGTTSQPKGVMLSHRAIIANLQALKCAHHLNADSIHYCVLPLYHVNAFGFSFLTTLWSRSQLILSDRFRTDNFWQILAAESCQTCNVVPEIVAQLIDKTALSKDLEESLRLSVKYFVSAASALSQDRLRKFLDKFSIKICQGYGLSETVNFSLLVSPFLNDAEYEEVMLLSPRPSVGTEIAGNDVMVRSLASDQACVENEIGEIAIRGLNVMSGYLDNPDQTAAAFKHGWFATGDLGYYRVIKGKNYFFITGRIKEIVKRKSETIYVQEIEECLQSLPGCELSAVAGFSNQWTGEELAAVVVKQPSTPSPEGILKSMQERVGFDKSPKIIRFISEIPRTGSMKVKRHELSLVFSDQYSTYFKH